MTPTPKRILVVDDEEKMRRVLRRILKARPHEVEAASDGRDALAATAQIRPDLIFLDMRMPRMDGHAFLAALREREEDPPPVVALTGERSDEAMLRGYGEGISYYVTKPFRAAWILNVVDYLLGDLSEAERRALAMEL